MLDTVSCSKCNKDLVIGEWPFCPHGHGANSVIGDDIPGGVEIRHGICNPDGTPKRYYTKSSMEAEAKRRGVTNRIEHVTQPGTDKNPFTQRWV